jgi:hypothetical protein
MLTYQILSEDDANSDRVTQKTLALMESAIAMNQMWLLEHPGDVCFLTCGSVKYDFVAGNTLSDTITIKTVPILKKTGQGLCISFVSFDVAIRRLMGEDAEPDVIPTDKKGLFHIRTAVNTPEGKVIVDPTHEILQLGGYRSAPAICKC